MTGPIRVTHVVGGRGGVGGAERVLSAIVDTVSGTEHQILVPFATPEEVVTLSALAAGTPVHAFGATTPHRLPAARRWVLDHVRHRQPHVLHAHLFHASVLVATLPQRSSAVKVLTHHHGSLYIDQRRQLEASLDRWAGTRYERIVAVSGAVADFLTDRYGYPSDQVELIHNGWNGAPQPRVSATTDFLTVARLRKEKGHETLVRAFRVVRDQEPATRLRLVGGGPERADLERLVVELGLVGAVEFTGDVEDVWTHYAASSVVVVPSLTETQGIVVLEAMAAGCPVIATRVGGIPEMVEDGTTGRLVPAADHRALAGAMLELYRSPALRSAFARMGREAADDWRMEQTVGRYDDLYRRLLDATGR